MTQLFTDAARATLASAINSTDTTITIASGGSLFPVANTGTAAIGPGADWFKLVLQDQTGFEIVYVRTHTSGSNTFSNVLRGQEGRAARGFLADSVAGLRLTAVDVALMETRELNAAVSAGSAEVFANSASSSAASASASATGANIAAANAETQATSAGAYMNAAETAAAAAEAALAAATAARKQQFVAGTDFTAGTTTALTLTESPIPNTKDALTIHFDAAYQQESEWTYDTSTGVVTFTSAIPTGVAKVEAHWSAPMATAPSGYVPGDARITARTLTTPDWLPMDGTQYSRASYPNLCDQIGALFTPLKLTNPATLPTTTGLGVAFSSDEQFLALAGGTGNISIYQRSGSTFTKLTNPTTPPPSTSHDVAFSPDVTYMAVAHDGSPFLSVYQRSSSTFTKLSDPASLPAGDATGVAFSPDGTLLAVSHVTTPFVTIYQRSGSTFTKLANPAALPPGNATGVAFSPDGRKLAVTSSTSPYVTVYARSGTTFTKVSDPQTAVAGAANRVAFSPDSMTMAVAHDNSPCVSLYQETAFGTVKLLDTTPIITATGLHATGVSFSGDGTMLAVSHYGTPYVTVFRNIKGVWTKIANPATLPTGSAEGVAFSKTGQYLAVTHSAAPRLTIYGQDPAADQFIVPLMPVPPSIKAYIKT